MILARQASKAQQERARLGLSALEARQGDTGGQRSTCGPRCSRRSLRSIARGGECSSRSPRTPARRAPRSGTPAHRAGFRYPAQPLSSIAADLFLAAGDDANARRAAEQACRGDGAAPRSIAALRTRDDRSTRPRRCRGPRTRRRRGLASRLLVSRARRDVRRPRGTGQRPRLDAARTGASGLETERRVALRCSSA